MDIAKVLAQLHSELANIDAAIESLERLQYGSRRPGRPPRRLGEDASRMKQGADAIPAHREALRRNSPGAGGS